ncbi:LPS translocon maturation chaperone LptM [Halomonas sp. V046]|uniref:LPS translocon maturation chaperone LptM n=1 Tax=Halomonas sp. V046 TaxID=3459611 RepID=UPI0040447F6D
MMKTLKIALLLTLLGVAVAGCGQKGPLYHPGDEAAAERYDPQGQNADDNDQGDATQDGAGERQDGNAQGEQDDN